MSIDSMFVHKMWDDDELSKMVKGGVPFPMLSDAGGKVGSIFGVFDENAGVEARGRFLIDPDGVIQGFEVLTPPVGRNVMEDNSPDSGISAGQGNQGRRGHSFWLAARQENPQAGDRSGRQGMGEMGYKPGI